MVDSSETEHLAHLHGEGAKYSEKFELHFEIIANSIRYSSSMADRTERYSKAGDGEYRMFRIGGRGGGNLCE